MAATRMKGGRPAVAVVRVQGRGQLTLPASFRKAVGVKPGDVLLLEERGPGHFEVRVFSRRSLLDFPRVDAQGFDMRSTREEMSSVPRGGGKSDAGGAGSGALTAKATGRFLSG